MSVNKTSSGRWEARWRDASGTSRSKTFRLKEDASKHERDQIAARDRGEYIDPASLKLTFKEYAESWRLVQSHHRARTAQQVELDFRLHVYPVLGDRRFRAIKPSDIRAWYAGLGLAHNTKRSIYTYVSAVFKAAVQDRIIPFSPCQLSVSRKDKDAAPMEVLTVEQVEEFSRAVEPRLYAAIVFAAGSGLRPGEWTGLTVDRVDFLRGTVKVDRQLIHSRAGIPAFGPPKSAAGFRTVPLAPGLVTILAHHVELYGTGPEGLLFVASSGAPLSSPALSRSWARGRKNFADLPGWATAHDLRHFYASCLIAHGCNVKQVQRALGHESAALTLDVYSHLWPDNDEQLRDVVQSALFADKADPEQSEGTTTLQ